MNLWVNDPVTKLPSVSLTMLLATFILVITAGALSMFGLVKDSSIFSEIFYSSVALYFGRRLNIANKTFSSDKAEEVINKIE